MVDEGDYKALDSLKVKRRRRDVYKSVKKGGRSTCRSTFGFRSLRGDMIHTVRNVSVDTIQKGIRTTYTLLLSLELVCAGIISTLGGEGCASQDGG